MTNLPSFLPVRAVVVVHFPDRFPSGREQEGRRPSVIIALPNTTGTTRYSLIVVVPLTTKTGDWITQNPTLYPRLQAGMGNLRYDSTVLLDQICALDIKRVLAYRGILTTEEYQPIEDGIKAMFGF